MLIANLKLATFSTDGRGTQALSAREFSDAVEKMLREKLDKIRTPRCVLTGLKVGGAVWVEPDLKAEIAGRRAVVSLGRLA